MPKESFQQKKDELLKFIDKIDQNNFESQREYLKNRIGECVDLGNLESNLSLLYDCAKLNLELIKNHTEEIKFSIAIQQDMRKERAEFFAKTLKDVSATLKESQIDDKVASRWIAELVNCYTESLSQSSSLIQDYTVDLLGTIRKNAEKIISEKAKLDFNGNE